MTESDVPPVGEVQQEDLEVTDNEWHTAYDSDDDGGTLFFINDEGIILTVEAVIDSHVTDDEVANLRSALRSGRRSYSSSTD